LIGKSKWKSVSSFLL